MTNVTQHFHGPVYGGVAGRDIDNSASCAPSQDDFEKRTGIWCPVDAQAALLALRGKSHSPSAVRLAWRLGYIAWDDKLVRLHYAFNWMHMALIFGLATGLSCAVFYLIPVGLASAPTPRWVAVFAYWAILFLGELVALELMVLRPWKVARMVRQVNVEHVHQTKKTNDLGSKP